MSGTLSYRACRVLLSLTLLGLAGSMSGQDLEPRAYSPAPVGTHFLVFGLGYSYGDVLLDPSLPVADVTADLGAVAPGYATTFDLAGRTASLAVVLPYAFGKMSGMIGEDFQEVTRSGIGDIRIRAAVNLLGGRALTPREFARRKPAPSLGASLVVVAPTGQYFPDKLVNIGTNRWAFKPELGRPPGAGRCPPQLLPPGFPAPAAPGLRSRAALDVSVVGQVRKQACRITHDNECTHNIQPPLGFTANGAFQTPFGPKSIHNPSTPSLPFLNYFQENYIGPPLNRRIS